MVDYVFERHLSGGILLPANKDRSTAAPIMLTERFRRAKRSLAAHSRRTPRERL